MSDNDTEVPLPDLNAAGAPVLDETSHTEEEATSRVAADLEAVFDVPVQVSAVLGRSKMDVSDLLKLGPGTVSRTRPPGRRSHRYLRQQPAGRARRSCARRGQAWRHHDRNHQGGTRLTTTDAENGAINNRSKPCGFSSLAPSRASLPPQPRSPWDNGASVTHAEDSEQAMRVVRGRQGR